MSLFDLEMLEKIRIRISFFRKREVLSTQNYLHHQSILIKIDRFTYRNTLRQWVTMRYFFRLTGHIGTLEERFKEQTINESQWINIIHFNVIHFLLISIAGINWFILLLVMTWNELLLYKYIKRWTLSYNNIIRYRTIIKKQKNHIGKLTDKGNT